MMDLAALILYGGLNAAMVIAHLYGRGRFYRFPFWAGMIALGWFYPQAIGGYINAEIYPPHAYADSMFFATLCTLALWVGFELANARSPARPCWLDDCFDADRLFIAASLLCLFGFIFQWKLQSLPEEMLQQTQWTGAPVKYLFLAGVFRIGFVVLWLLYLHQRRWLSTKMLVFIIPCMLLLLEAVILRGRRSVMMNLAAYIIFGLWFVRRISVPSSLIVYGLLCGLILINGIGTYRSIMKKEELSFSARLFEAMNADYMEESLKNVQQSGAEFNNYIFYRQMTVDTGAYDYGLVHWNRFVFNYVPAQVFGREFKDSLKIETESDDLEYKAEEDYGHTFMTGTTVTGYKDAFGSFGWFGFIKFLLIGAVMGILYRHAMQGALLGQLLYIYFLAQAMQSISHGTNDILIRVWIYFFVMGYPVLYWARSACSAAASNLPIMVRSEK